MNLNSCWQISSKQIRWLVSLPQLHLSPLLCASVTPPPPPPPLLLYFLCHRRLLSCSRLNPDRHCLSVVMATIRRSLSTANCCRGIYFSWCDSSLCKASLSVSAGCAAAPPCFKPLSHTDVALQRWEPCWQKSMANEPWNSFYSLFFGFVIFFLPLVSLVFWCFP